MLLKYLGDFCNILDEGMSDSLISFSLNFLKSNEIIEDENDVFESCGILISELNRWLIDKYCSKHHQLKVIVKVEGNCILFEFIKIIFTFVNINKLKNEKNAIKNLI